MLEGGVNDIRAGEVFPIFNRMVKVDRIEGGDKPIAYLHLLTDDYAQESLKHLGKGVFLSENSTAADKKSVSLESVSTSKEDESRLLITLGHYSYAKDRFEPIEPVKVGDTIKLDVYSFRITHAQLGDKQKLRRGWIAMEPIFEQPMIPVE